MSFNSSRLLAARKRRGLTQTKLAEYVDLSVRSIKAYEAGEKSPSADVVDNLARALEFPVSFFMAEEPIDSLDIETVSFRSLKSLTARSRDAGLVSASLAMSLDSWINEHFVLPEVDVPRDLADSEPELAADALRRAWSLGEAPIGNMVHLLEAKGVRVFSLAQDCHALDAFSLWRDAVPYVFLNTIKSAAHSRMDAAHELGHLLLHRDRRANGRDAEDDATRFASAFLMPQASLKALGTSSNFTLPNLIHIKQGWGVSVSALVVRLHRLGQLSTWQYRTLFVELSKQGFRKSEPYDWPRERSAILQKMFELLRSEGMTMTALADKLTLSTDELTRLVFGLCIIGVEGGELPSDQTARAPLRLVEP